MKSSKILKSMRFQVFAFMALLLIVLLLLLNYFPIVSSRDSVFREKESAATSQAALLASSLATLDNPSHESVAEVLRLLDIRDYDQVLVADAEGNLIYGSAPEGLPKDMETALHMKTVFRSDYTGSSFVSSCAWPMSRQGQLLGAVYLLEQDSQRADIISQLDSQIRIISVLLVFIVLGLSLVFSSFFVSRIGELSQAMHIVAGGDYAHRLKTRGRDELAELGEEFNLLTERLEDTERQRRRFVSDASHELKTPLASIRLLADSIVQNQDMDAETVREFVTDIGNEAGRLQRTTEKLLDLSRLDDDIHLQKEPVDLKQVAMDVIELLRPLAAENQVSLRSRLDDGCVVMAAGDDIYHIIFNLTENAIKYDLPGGYVEISVRSANGAVLLIVEDSGIGIPEKERYNIFTRFYRVDKARSREAGGSGLGLSIVHDAVKQNGGSITVGDNKPRGSRFTVSFPIPTSEETGI